MGTDIFYKLTANIKEADAEESDELLGIIENMIGGLCPSLNRRWFYDTRRSFEIIG